MFPTNRCAMDRLDRRWPANSKTFLGGASACATVKRVAVVSERAKASGARSGGA